MTAQAQPNSFRTGPDERGHFGIFGGRFVAETLMPIILELEKAYEDGEERSGLPCRHGELLDPLHRPPEPALFRRAHDRASRRREDLLQARRAEPHRRAQGEQRAGPDPSRPPHGQEAHHRRDRRRPARRRHRDALRPLRSRLRRLYGRGRRGAAEAQRVPHEHARRQGRAGAVRHADPEGRHERGPARLGHQRRRHLLLHRHGGGAASLSGHGARLPVRHRQRDPRADDAGRRPPAGFARRLHRRRLQRHRPVPPVPRRHRTSRSTASKRPATASTSCTRPRSPAAARACCTATAPTCS